MRWTDYAAFAGLILGTVAAYQVARRSLPGQYPMLSGWLIGTAITAVGMGITAQSGADLVAWAGAALAGGVCALIPAWLGKRRGKAFR